MRHAMLLVFMAALMLASHASAQAVDQVRFAQVADVALVAKILPFPTEPTQTPASPQVFGPVIPSVTGHSTSLSWHELQQSMFCKRVFDFKMREWKICDVTAEMRANMVGSWISNRKKVGGNVPAWMNEYS